MAGLAFDARLDVAVVTELDVLREAMELDPLDRLLLFPMFLEDTDALDLVVLGRELAMAAHAELNGGNARRLGTIGSGVTIKALDLELAGVMLMAERNRLERALGLRVPGVGCGLTRGRRRPLLVVCSRDLDLEVGIVFFLRTKLMRFANAGRDEDVTTSGGGGSVGRRRPSGPEDEGGREEGRERADREGAHARHPALLARSIRRVCIRHRRIRAF